MVKVSKELKTFEEFLTGLKLSAEAKVEKTPEAKDIYRKFHALLCWQVVLSDDPSQIAKIRLEECLSDFSAAYLLFLASAYKPAIASLRGGIENFIRAILHFEGVDSEGVGMVWELFVAAKDHFKRVDGNVEARIISLHSAYGELCKFVHTSSVEYMSLRVPFQCIFKYSQKEYVITRGFLADTFRLSHEALFLVAHTRIAAVHHRIGDEIRDALSPQTKALAN